MAFRLVALSALAPADVRAWADLAERAAEPNPYLHPDFVLAAARAEVALDRVHVAIVTGSDGWACCLPVAPARRWRRRVPIPGTRAWLHDQCLLGTPQVAPEAPERSLAELLAGLRHAARGMFLELDWADDDGPAGAALHRALPGGALAFGPFERAALVRREQPTYLEGRLRGKHRRSLRRLASQLSERLGGELLLADRTGDGDAVSRFLALEAAGWKGRRGTALASTPTRERFFRELVARFVERGALELLFLEAAGRVVAARCNLRAAGVLFCFKVAHDEELRSFSPGVQLELLMVERFHADSTLRRMDSCADRSSELFNRLWPDRRRLTGVLVPASGPVGWAMRPAFRAGAAIMDRRRAAVGAAAAQPADSAARALRSAARTADSDLIAVSGNSSSSPQRMQTAS
jgi:CelD/BcsL family acetyltransferase involved in cellulose biosynthesis